MGKTLTGAERAQRAGERLAEYRAQLASVQARMAQAGAALADLAKLERSAQVQVSVAEKAVEAAAERVTDLHAQVLVAVGSDDETPLTAAHGAAVDARKTARAALDEARAELEATRQKIASEAAPIKAQLAEDDEARRDLAKLIASLELAQTKAHRDAGIEAIASAHERRKAIEARIAEHKQGLADAQSDLEAHYQDVKAIAAAHPDLTKTADFATVADDRRALCEIGEGYLAYLALLDKWAGHPETVGVWHEGQYLPSILADSRLNMAAIHSILSDASAKYRGIVAQVRSTMVDLLANGEKRAAYEASRKPAAAVAEG